MPSHQSQGFWLRAKVISLTCPRDLFQVGLFRKSGVKSRIHALRQMNENFPENVSYEDQSAYDVADMVKQFFRDLPEPLFTNKLSDTFLHIYQCKWQWRRAVFPCAPVHVNRISIAQLLITQGTRESIKKPVAVVVLHFSPEVNFVHSLIWKSAGDILASENTFFNTKIFLHDRVLR